MDRQLTEEPGGWTEHQEISGRVPSEGDDAHSASFREVRLSMILGRLNGDEWCTRREVMQERVAERGRVR